MYKELEIQYISNMEYLKNHQNAVYQKILEADISHLGIHPTPFGINIDSNGEMIYPQNVDAAVDHQVDTFLSNPTAIFKKPPRNLEDYGSKLHSTLLKSIENISSYGYKQWNEYSLNPNLTTLPLAIMAGIGSGKHIEKLLEKKDIKHLIIIDSDFAFLKLSMHIVDWAKIISYFNRPDYEISFSISDKPISLAYSLMGEIFESNPYKAYFIPYYTHYKSNFFDDIKTHLIDKSQLMFQGLGFIDDELNSLRKTLKNLDHNIPVYMGTNDIPKNSTLFIVASGPSLDNDIEYIKKHKDDVVIFSCGTALRILEKNGITPDFHFEVEREESVHNVLQQYTSKHIRDKIALIGVNVLYDKVFTDNFKESYIYFRVADAGSSIVPNTIPRLQNCNPTVTNGAIAFASEFAWENIYLFGADMGFKDKDKHHSKDAFQYTPNEKDINWHTQSGNDITHHLEANFGEDKVYCTSVFFWTKQMIERAASMYKMPIKNCSDGIKIKSTTSFHAKDIVIEKSKKKKTIKDMKKNFKDLKTNTTEFRENYVTQVELFYTMIDKIKNKIRNKDIKSFADIFLILDRSFDIFRQMEIAIDKGCDSRKLVGTSILRGTIVTAYSSIYANCLATYDLKKATKFATEAFDLIVLHLENFKKEIK